MKALVTLLTIGALMFGTFNAHAAVCTAIASGDWSDATIWSCGVSPGCGDFAIIPAGKTVNIDSHVLIDESSMPVCSSPTYIQVFGILNFVTGKKMELACGSSVEIMAGGLLQSGGGGGSSNWLKICDGMEWKASDGDVPGYHLFGSPIPLPATLISFKTENFGATVNVNWTLASERSVDHYEVDFSVNGADWETLATVASRGNHSSSVTYSTSVSSQPVSLGYFRLISIDIDGTRAELSRKSHEFEQPNQFTAYPNPVRSGTSIMINSGVRMQQDISFEVVDLNGRAVERGVIPEGRSSVIVETSSFKQGVYLIRFTDSYLENIRIVVE